MLDFYLNEQADGLLSTYVDAAGVPRMRDSNQQVREFFYTLYKLPALTYLVSVKDFPRLREGIIHGVPLYRKELQNAAGYLLASQFTGTRNYAKFAARQAFTQLGELSKPHSKPDRSIPLDPGGMGGI